MVVNMTWVVFRGDLKECPLPSLADYKVLWPQALFRETMVQPIELLVDIKMAIVTPSNWLLLLV